MITEKQSGEIIGRTLKTIRHNSSDRAIAFEISEESDGTQKIIDFIPMLIALTQWDAVFVVDEIERSLHSVLLENIFNIFLDFYKNSENCLQPKSQLIATTHDTHLLVATTSEQSFLDRDKIFRKDEIWFMEKDKMGQSIAYSLANTDVDNLDLAKGYFNGRFGALNFVRKEKIQEILLDFIKEEVNYTIF